MANPKGNPQNLRPAKKGEVRNPEGGRSHNPEMKRLKHLTEQEMIEIGSLVVLGSVDELRAIAKDGSGSALKCMMAAVAVRTISKGDPHALDVLLNRLVGKPKETVNFTGSLATANAVITREEFKRLKDEFDSEY